MKKVILSFYLIIVTINFSFAQETTDFKIVKVEEQADKYALTFKLLSKSFNLEFLFDNFITGVPKIEKVVLKEKFYVVYINAGEVGTRVSVKQIEGFIFNRKDNSLIYRNIIDEELYEWIIEEDKVIVRSKEDSKELTFQPN